MKALYDAASALIRAISMISNAQPWSFSGSLFDLHKQHLPKELYSFVRWVIQGPNSSDAKLSAVNKNVQTSSQKKKHSEQTVTEMPQQVVVGVAIRQAIRSKKVINIFF